MTTNKDPLAFQLFTEVSIIEQLSRNQLEHAMPEGLKISQFSVLNHLVRLGGEWSPVRLANAFQVTKGAMTNTLKRLESRNLVEVFADPSDGRGKLVTITVAGEVMRQKCLQSVAPFLADLSEEISIADYETILPVLEKIRKYLDTNRT